MSSAGNRTDVGRSFATSHTRRLDVESCRRPTVAKHVDNNGRRVAQLLLLNKFNNIEQRKRDVPGNRDVYLVGSIPLTRPYDVFTTVAELLGDRIRRVPDGEIGDRKMWVQSQYPILAAAPGLE